MRRLWHALSIIILSAIPMLLLTACGVTVNTPGFFGDKGTPGATGGTGTVVSIALSGASSVALGAQSQYVATVTGATDTSVAWSVNGVQGGNRSAGTISSAGIYTAPTTTSAFPTSITITATSVASPSTSKSLTVALTGAAVQPAGAVTLTLTGAVTVALDASTQYSAVVSGSSNSTVVWSVNGVAGGSQEYGVISATGLYTAPSNMPSGSKVTITAASAADSAVSQSLRVALMAAESSSGAGGAITVALSGASSVALGQTAQYSATVGGTSDAGVTWSVNGVTGGDAAVGMISTSGVYIAPKIMPANAVVTVTATSVDDASASQSLQVTLTESQNASGTSGIGETQVTLALSGASSVQLTAAAQYTATVAGSSNTAVTWSVDGVQGGEASVGTITSAGRYTAPVSMPPAGKVMITATSVASSSVSQSMTVTLTAPAQSIGLTLNGATSVTLGTTAQYTAVVSNSSNTGVKWSVNQLAGGNATYGTISTSGLYTAPGTAPQPSTVTITATAAADSSVVKSLVVALTAPTSASRIPANAVSSGDLDPLSNWQWTHDPGTSGSSSGSSVFPVTGLSSDNVARAYYMTYANGGGEIYHVSFARDTVATHFVYDAYVYVADPSQLKNLEMDMNDVMSDGRLIILGTQCSGYSGTWEYTLYSNGGFHWKSSNIACNPATWTAKTWHHIQIATHRDSSGNGYYDWVNVDGKYSDFSNASGADAANLGWAVGTLLINFQIDGPSKKSGGNTIYTDKLQVWRW